MKRTIAVFTVLFIIFTLAFTGCTAKETEKKQFRMGLDETFAPMGFRDENNEIVGFDVDMAAEVCSRLGYELVLVPIDWDSKELELSSGNIDCIWNGLTINPSREAEMLFSAPYLANSQTMIVMADSGITDVSELAGQTVGTQAGSSAYELLETDEALAAAYPNIEVYPDYDSALLDLEIGRIQAVVGDKVLLKYKESLDPDKYLVLDVTLAEEFYGVAFVLGNQELRDAVQGAIDEMVADGTAAEISTKWFGGMLVLN